jgi:transcriptional regulator with XRE-family HTH domain
MVVEKQTQASLADHIGVSRSFLNEVIRGSRPPTGKILDFLNLERHVIYTKKGEKK